MKVPILIPNIFNHPFTYIDATKKLSKGDTFRFQSNRDHTLKNISKQKAKVLMVNYIDPVNGSFN